MVLVTPEVTIKPPRMNMKPALRPRVRCYSHQHHQHKYSYYYYDDDDDFYYPYHDHRHHYLLAASILISLHSQASGHPQTPSIHPSIHESISPSLLV